MVLEHRRKGIVVAAALVGVLAYLATTSFATSPGAPPLLPSLPPEHDPELGQKMGALIDKGGAPEMPLTHRSIPTQPTVDDREVWEKLPRKDYRLATAFAHLAPQLDIESLFRHEALNEADKYIPKEMRDELARVVKSYQNHLETVSQLQSKAAYSEMTELIKRGMTRKMSLNKQVDEDGTVWWGLPKVGPDGPSYNVWRDVEGEPGMTHLASMTQMPNALMARRYSEYRSIEMGGLIINWFRFHGFLSEGTALRLLSELTDPALVEPKATEEK